VLRAGIGTQTDEVASAPVTVDYDQSSPFRPARQERLLTRIFPVAGELTRYRGPSARRDAVAVRPDQVAVVMSHSIAGSRDDDG
jgi:hypothetical protein